MYQYFIKVCSKNKHDIILKFVLCLCLLYSAFYALKRLYQQYTQISEDTQFNQIRWSKTFKLFDLIIYWFSSSYDLKFLTKVKWAVLSHRTCKELRSRSTAILTRSFLLLWSLTNQGECVFLLQSYKAKKYIHNLNINVLFRQVTFTEEHISFLHFLTNVCAIVGGICL